MPATKSSAAGTAALPPADDRDEGVFPCRRAESRRDLPPPRHAELLAKRIAVRLGRSGRDAEALADLFVRAAGRDERDDFTLASGDRRDPARESFVHGAGGYPRSAAVPIDRKAYLELYVARTTRSRPTKLASCPRAFASRSSSSSSAPIRFNGSTRAQVRAHHLGPSVEHDVPFTIATDGPEMMRTHLRDELDLLRRIGALDEDELREANARGHDASFVAREGVLRAT